MALAMSRSMQRLMLLWLLLLVKTANATARITGDALNVQLMVTSKLDAGERRMSLRRSIKHCLKAMTLSTHTVELHFFLGLGGVNETSESVLNSLLAEEEEFADLVFLGGPDSDPSVPRDVTYVLDRPSARGSRLAYGTVWLLENRPNLDFVAYIDDDSYIHVPRLLTKLEQHPSESLAMGYVMQTQLDTTQADVCDVCNLCDWCKQDEQLNRFCEKFPLMSLGGCISLLHMCQLNHRGQNEAECVQTAQDETFKVSRYFGSSSAMRWMLGMGWILGRRIVKFIARNAEDLKKHGIPDVQLGFWLAPLEGIEWVDLSGGQFHDYPEPGSSFSAGCTDRSILVHRMTAERWQDFDEQTCELGCPSIVE
eukprot:TRINITY_DN64845_c0_g1_i1.p1 TRINITY_DN64845_c0_g1~~TRINITY_DN64845_c0_g1_i1.p1  ORF type:complete len:367 (+),score=44.67 TRINITY_DN64845_c0_g1_i1:116-1216(+)